MPVVSLDRGQLHYETRGAGPPIVMLLPVSRGPEGLEPLIELLGTGFLVIRYDQIGHGASTSTGNPQDGRPAGPVPLSVRAAEVVALLDHLGIERANLLAHSTGCGIALEIFAAAPERVRAMALISPWSHGDDQLRTMQSPGCCRGCPQPRRLRHLQRQSSVPALVLPPVRRRLQGNG